MLTTRQTLWPAVRTAVLVSSLIGASLYGALLIIYVGPKGPFRACFSRVWPAFDMFCYQRWNFFAPPPTYNQAIYMDFSVPSSPAAVTRLDILSPVLELKRSRAPFNSRETTLDYILSSSGEHISRAMATPRAVKTDQEKLIAEAMKTPAFRTLLNYAKIVALKNNIPLTESVRIIIVRRPLRPFRTHNSDAPATPPKETLVFESPSLPLSTL